MYRGFLERRILLHEPGYASWCARDASDAAFRNRLYSDDGYARRPRRRVADRLSSGEIQQHHVGALLHALEDHFTAVRGDVEIANVEIGRKVGYLPLSTYV